MESEGASLQWNIDEMTKVLLKLRQKTDRYSWGMVALMLIEPADAEAMPGYVVSACKFSRDEQNLAANMINVETAMDVLLPPSLHLYNKSILDQTMKPFL